MSRLPPKDITNRQSSRSRAISSSSLGKGKTALSSDAIPNFTPVLPSHIEQISSNFKQSISRKNDTTRLENLTKPKKAPESVAAAMATPFTKEAPALDKAPALDRKAQLEAWKASKKAGASTTSSCGHASSSTIYAHCQECARRQRDTRKMLVVAKMHAEANKMPSRVKARVPTPPPRPSRKHAQVADKDAIHSVVSTADVTELFEGLQLARLKHNWIIANHESELKRIDAAIMVAVAEKEKVDSDRRHAETKAAMIADIEALDEISSSESIFLMQMISGYIELVKELDRHVANTKRPLVLGDPSNLPKLAMLQDKVQTCKLTLSNATQNSKQWRDLVARQAHVQAMRLHDLLGIVESQINELLRCAKLEQKQMYAAIEAMSKEHSRQLAESSKAGSIPELGQPVDTVLPSKATQDSSKKHQPRDVVVPRADLGTNQPAPSAHHHAGPTPSSHHRAGPAPISHHHAGHVDRQQASVPVTSFKPIPPPLHSTPSLQNPNVIPQPPYQPVPQSVPLNALLAQPYFFPLAQQMSMPMRRLPTASQPLDPAQGMGMRMQPPVMPLSNVLPPYPIGNGQMTAQFPMAAVMPSARPSYPVMSGQVMQQMADPRMGTTASAVRGSGHDITSKSKRPSVRQDPPPRPTAAPAMHALMPPARNKKKVPGQPEDDGRPKPPRLFGR